MQHYVVANRIFILILALTQCVQTTYVDSNHVQEQIMQFHYNTTNTVTQTLTVDWVNITSKYKQQRDYTT